MNSIEGLLRYRFATRLREAGVEARPASNNGRVAIQSFVLFLFSVLYNLSAFSGSLTPSKANSKLAFTKWDWKDRLLRLKHLLEAGTSSPAYLIADLSHSPAACPQDHVPGYHATR